MVGLTGFEPASGQAFEMLRKLLHDFNVPPLTRLAAEVIASEQNSPR
jgi:hypothetical protein